MRDNVFNLSLIWIFSLCNELKSVGCFCFNSLWSLTSTWEEEFPLLALNTQLTAHSYSVKTFVFGRSCLLAKNKLICFQSQITTKTAESDRKLLYTEKLHQQRHEAAASRVRAPCRAVRRTGSAAVFTGVFYLNKGLLDWSVRVVQRI